MVAPPAPPVMAPPPVAPQVRNAMAEGTAVVSGNDLFGDGPLPPPVPANDLASLLDATEEKTLPPGLSSQASAPPPRHSNPAIPVAPGRQPAPGARPLPPTLGEPVRPAPPVVAPRAAPAPAQEASAYRPRMQEPKVVQGGAKRSKLLVAAVGGGLSLALVAVVALLFMNQDGAVLVAYEPRDATVLIDGTEVCNASPCVANKIRSGLHRLEVRKELFEPFATEIDVPAGDIYRTSPDVKLKPLNLVASAVIACDPSDAEIKVNGKVVKELGRPGIFSGELKVGEAHEIVVSKPGFAPWQKSLTPSASDKNINEFAGPLQPLKLVVKFTSTPDGAEVLVDGKAVGHTPFTIETVDPSATHAVVFRKKCHEDATHTILPGGGTINVEKTLARKSSCP